MTVRIRHAAHQIDSLQSRAISAGFRVLESEGVENANLRAIADEAGVGVASIYHYFKTKDELLSKMALIGLQDLLDDIRRHRADPKGLSPTRAAGTAFFAFVQAKPQLFALMFNPRLLARHEVLRQAEQRIFRDYEDALNNDDRVPEPHREKAAYAIWALGRGMAAMVASYGGSLPPDKAQKLWAGARFLIDRQE